MFKGIQTPVLSIGFRTFEFLLDFPPDTVGRSVQIGGGPFSIYGKLKRAEKKMRLSHERKALRLLDRYRELLNQKKGLNKPRS